MEENIISLDQEFKRYLQILRPYLGQLIDEEAIKLCNAWIQRLSKCNDREKSMRNKYIFVLCYQLSKGILEDPFLNFPPEDDLSAFSEFSDSISSSEVEYLVIDQQENNTKILYNRNRPVTSDTEKQSKTSKDNDFDTISSNKSSMSQVMTTACKGNPSNATRKQTVLCYTCPKLMKACSAEISSDLCDLVQDEDQYEYRTNNLIMRLRDIKQQNILLQHELIALKEESKGNTISESLLKVNTATSAYFQAESSATLKSIKNKLQSVEEDRKNLLHTLDSLQEQLDNMQEIKRREIENIEARHKMEIFKIKSDLRDENKLVYEKKIEQLKEYYENLIQNSKVANNNEIKSIMKSQNELHSEKCKVMQEEITKLKEKHTEVYQKLHELEQSKIRELQEKDHIIQSKDIEITKMNNKLEEEKTNFSTVFKKLAEKPSHEDSSADNIKLKAQELEKRVMKMEKSKAKCIKAYEIKYANLQREKHLAECSLQLQLVRQRAQVVAEMTNDNQEELNTSLDKLESKYKEIVANVQSTAIERKLQDEMTLSALVKAACACSMRNEVSPCNFLGKTVNRNQESHQSCDSVSGLIRNKMGDNKSYGEDSAPGGYCLNGEKLSQFLEKVYIPQRDYDFSQKK